MFASAQVDKFALYDEAPGGGNAGDPASLRNRPLVDPASWLDLVYLHSDLDLLEVVSDTTVGISHAAVPAAAGSAPGTAGAVPFAWPTATATHVLVTHSLGYEPYALIVIGNKVVAPGLPVQVGSDGSGRYVTAYVTATTVVLHESASAGVSGLAAAGIFYRVMIFRAPVPPSGTKAMELKPATNDYKFARERIDLTRRYLQIAPGGSPFGLSTGKTIDARNGAPRFVNPDGTIYDPVPAAFGLAMVNGPAEPLNSMAYSGSFLGSPSILVQAP